MPVISLVGKVGDAIVALTGPLTWLHAPVPTTAAFAAMVAAPAERQAVRSLPALAVVGGGTTVMLCSSVIVQLFVIATE